MSLISAECYLLNISPYNSKCHGKKRVALSGGGHARPLLNIVLHSHNPPWLGPATALERDLLILAELMLQKIICYRILTHSAAF